MGRELPSLKPIRPFGVAARTLVSQRLLPNLSISHTALSSFPRKKKLQNLCTDSYVVCFPRLLLQFSFCMRGKKAENEGVDSALGRSFCCVISLTLSRARLATESIGAPPPFTITQPSVGGQVPADNSVQYYGRANLSSYMHSIESVQLPKKLLG